MDKTNEQGIVDVILNDINLLVETKPYKRRQLLDFKDLINKVLDIQNKDLLRTCYNNRGIDLIWLICRHNKKKLLRYLLHESQVLHYFTSENKDIENKRREDTFYSAICSNQFKIIEMLYDHWTGDLHWLGHKKEYNDFDVKNLSQINKSLKTALERYEAWTLSKVSKKIDQNMMFHVHSLMALSEFQMDLYSKLNKLKEDLITIETEPVDIIRLKETYAIRNMILDMFNCYEENTTKLGSVFQNSDYDNPKDIDELNKLNEFLETPKDSSKILPKTYLYVFFEVFFRKLDYNICLLILDNLHSLKLRLTMPEGSYQKLENKVYHFIYHLSSNWKLYIPKKRNLKTKSFSGRHNNIDCNFLLKYNTDTFQRGLHIIYLERRDFESALHIFKNELQHRNVEENIRKDKIELPIEEVNGLMLLPELRDIYSLKRISQQIAQLYSIDAKYAKECVCLLIERNLQVVGEFLKSTDETLHLQPTTEALAEVETSVEIVNDLKTLRDILCHVKDGEILRRIEIEKNNYYIFETILNELKFMKKKIDEVILVYKPIVEKALILNGLSLIENRKNEMPYEVANDLFMAVKRVTLFPKDQPYVEFIRAQKGYADEFASEVIILVEHSLQLESKLISVTEKIRTNITRKFAMYKESIQSSLQKITEVKTNWQNIVQAFKNKIPSVTLLDYPNENDANRIKTYSKKVDLGDDTLNRLIEDNMLFAYAEIHWKFIKKILEFILVTSETGHYTSIELGAISRELKNLTYNNNDIEKIVGDYLLMIENNIDTCPNMKHKKNECPEFIGIKELRRNLTMVNFLILEEKKYLIDTLENMKNNSKIKKKEKIEQIIDIINKSDAIPKKVCTNFITTIDLHEKAQKLLINLVMGYKRDPLHQWCMSKRIALLREIIKQQSVTELVAIYKFDKTFRVLLEVLVFDILAILECTKNNEIVKKSNKLLTEINLRNFLIHGSPLLEIVGNVLDSNDLPTELITKALELLKEERPINALCALKDLDFDFHQINNDTLTPEHQALVTEFKTSARWKDYLTFIPELKKPVHNKKKKITEIDNHLLEAVNKKDPVLVQEKINQGGNVNLVDDYKRALVHHAAIKGSVDVLKVLLNNGADVNMRSKYNMTALHYSAMNGFTAAVEVLLTNGADCFALNDKGQTPVDLARQRKHTNVCHRLEESMKK